MIFAGLRNLIMVLFAATTIRLMIENFLKYGIRINPKNWVMAVLTPEGRRLLYYDTRQIKCVERMHHIACCQAEWF